METVIEVGNGCQERLFLFGGGCVLVIPGFEVDGNRLHVSRSTERFRGKTDFEHEPFHQVREVRPVRLGGVFTVANTETLADQLTEDEVGLIEDVEIVTGVFWAVKPANQIEPAFLRTEFVAKRPVFGIVEVCTSRRKSDTACQGSSWGTRSCAGWEDRC